MSTDYKKLSDAHPLFTRLSGQVIWLLMEENDVSETDINAFMDSVMEWRESHLDAMQELQENPEKYMLITVDRIDDLPEDQHSCATCEKLNGKILPASHPDLIKMLPPYSLGCRARAKVISKKDVPQTAKEMRMEDCPKHSFMCPTGWFLNYPWAAKAKAT